MKAFAFAGSLINAALYLIGGNGATESFSLFCINVWDVIKSAFFAGLSLGLSLLEIILAILHVVAACVIGVGALAYYGGYYIVVGIIWAVTWFFDGLAYDPDTDYPLY